MKPVGPGRRHKKVKTNNSVFQYDRVVAIQIANKPVQIRLKHENDSSQTGARRIKRKQKCLLSYSYETENNTILALWSRIHLVINND